MTKGSSLKVGSARMDISPGPECPLIGYEFRAEELPDGNEGVHDPLFVRVLVFEDEGGRSVILNYDLCTFATDVARKLRTLAAEKAGTTFDRVIVSCTHTHSGPYPIPPSEDRSANEQLFGRGEDHPATRAYQDYYLFLVRQTEAAVAKAAARLYPAEVAVQEAPLGLGYVRRVPRGDSVAMCWNAQEQDELPLRPLDDPTCTVVVIRQTNGQRHWVLFSLGIHGTVLGKTSNVVSADWAGEALRRIEELMPGSQAFYFFGACGDVHPWIATQENPANLVPIGMAAAGFVASVAYAVRTVAMDQVRILSETITVGTSELDISIWRLGALTVVALPVELFGGLARDLRERVEGPILLITEGNGRTGYWPTEAAFREGNYEVDAALAAGRVAGDSERLIDEIVTRISALK